MRTITICYDQSGYTYRWLKAINGIRSELKELGYKVEFLSIFDYFPLWRFCDVHKVERRVLKNLNKGSFDILFMAFHHSTSLLGQMEAAQRKDIMSNIRKRTKTLVWLDTADSTGTCLFDVMPFVDLYFKKQTLSDLSLYCKPMYGNRYFCDYYHNLLGKDDQTITDRQYVELDDKYKKKIRISWNVGLGDLYSKSNLDMYVRPFRVRTPLFTSPNTNRDLDVQYRGTGYSPIAGYPRSQSKKLLSEMSNIKVSDMAKRIPKQEYIEEGKNSKCILSPFGWGEICGRDFEAFVYGACMVKQSMECILTYPNIYVVGCTYVPLKWDFSDFKETLSKASSNEFHEIAIKGQEYYKSFFTKEGRIDFAKHLISELER